MFEALKAMGEIAEFGLQIRMGETCGVVIAYGVHVRAIWHAGNGDYDLFLAGNNEPATIVHTLEDVIDATRDFLNLPNQSSSAPPRCVCAACG